MSNAFYAGYDAGFDRAQARTWAFFLSAVAVAFTILVGFMVHQGQPVYPLAPKASSTVYIAIGDHGICSGVYLGNNLVLTAAHCEGDAEKDTLTIKTSTDGESTAQKLWVNKTADLMLLKGSFLDGTIKASHLSCRKPVLGEPVESSGNPYSETFLTTHGYVSGTDRISNGRVITPLDITMLPGMSGGPVLDQDGNVIGINDAVLLSKVMGSPIPARVPSGIGFMVPSYVACELMGEGRS